MKKGKRKEPPCGNRMALGAQNERNRNKLIVPDEQKEGKYGI